MIRPAPCPHCGCETRYRSENGELFYREPYFDRYYIECPMCHMSGPHLGYSYGYEGTVRLWNEYVGFIVHGLGTVPDLNEIGP